MKSKLTLIALASVLSWSLLGLGQSDLIVAQELANSLSDASPPANQRREGDWLVQQNEQTGVTLNTRELTLYPRLEPKPALKHRLIADRFDLWEGNAATYYLKAMGFFEETLARQKIDQFQNEMQAKLQAGDIDQSSLPPDVWYQTAPRDLPIDEVKKYLRWHSFQPPLLREAARRNTFSLDRNIREVKDPIVYLLPEIQAMRQLARVQKIRVRLALAENRIQDAIEIQGQQYALASHLGGDQFFVSNLVGAAIAGMAWEDALHLIQHPDAPNLYWAFASLPSPVIDMQDAMAFERQFLFEQVKSLRDVDEKPRSVGYWVEFLDRIQGELHTLISFEANLDNSDPEIFRAKFIAIIAAAYPGALQYLIEKAQIDADQARAYPQLQTVLLAVKRFYEQTRDEHFKWQYLNFHLSDSNVMRQQLSQTQEESARKLGWAASVVELILPSLHALRAAQQRVQQHLAMLQSIESIRVYAAENNGRLPTSLDRLSLPAPVDPFSGKPFQYDHNGDTAILTGTRTPHMQYRLVLRIAK